MQSPTSETCRALIAQLSGFLDGELDAARCEKIERHLATCSYCRAIADTTQTMLALYHGAREDVPRSAHAHLLQVLGLTVQSHREDNPACRFRLTRTPSNRAHACATSALVKRIQRVH
jgi:anti-sigma factor RsiW